MKNSDSSIIEKVLILLLPLRFKGGILLLIMGMKIIVMVRFLICFLENLLWMLMMLRMKTSVDHGWYLSDDDGIDQDHVSFM